jgi:hypothetical protein
MVDSLRTHELGRANLQSHVLQLVRRLREQLCQHLFGRLQSSTNEPEKRMGR